jgi:ATP-dependent Clp protease ATP-binding subunit ClpA
MGLLERAIRWLVPAAGGFDRLDERSRRTLFFAHQAVIDLGGRTIEPEHLLLGLLKDQPEILSSSSNRSIDLDRLISELRGSVARTERVPKEAEIPFSRRTKHVLRKWMEQAGAHAHVRPEHLVLALLGEDDRIAQVLETHGVMALNVRERLTHLG